MRRHRRRWLAAGLLIGILTLLAGGRALAAEFGEGDIYRLEAGEVVDDDLIVAANEVYIAGTVRGDLVAIGSYVEVSGTVTGDAMVAGASVNLSGSVEDDARIGGAGVDISGRVGDDLFAAAGGDSAGTLSSFQVNRRTVEAGLRVADSAQVGGSAYLAAGTASVGGVIAGDLGAGAGALSLGAQVEGDADVSAERLTFDEGASVAGTLRYSAPQPVEAAAGVAEPVEYTPPEARADQPAPQPGIFSGLLGRVVRVVLLLLGFALVGWLLLRFRPQALEQPAGAIADQPARVGAFGLVASLLLIFVPLLSGLLVLLLWAFWGWAEGLVMLGFLFTALTLVWLLSPLVTGLWLGRWLTSATGRTLSPLLTLLTGVALIVLLGQVPCLGWLVYLASFVFAIGGIILSQRSGAERQLAPAPAMPA